MIALGLLFLGLICCAHASFLAIGDAALRSDDGKQWQSVPSPFRPKMSSNALAYDPSRSLVVSVGDTILFSRDNGNTWATASVSSSTDTFLTVAFSPDHGLFLAGRGGGDGGPSVVMSKDGANWTSFDAASRMFSETVRQITYIPEKKLFFIAGNGTSYSLASFDGATLTGIPSLFRVAYAISWSEEQQLWVLGGDADDFTDYAALAWSTDLKLWTPANVQKDWRRFTEPDALVYGNGKWVATGFLATVEYSSDGKQWNVTRFEDMGYFISKILPLRNGMFISVGGMNYMGQKSCVIGFSADGVTWAPANVPSPLPGVISDIIELA